MALDCDQTPCYSSGEINYGEFRLTFEGDENSLTLNIESKMQAIMCQDTSVPQIIKYLYVYKKTGVHFDTLVTPIKLCDESISYPLKYDFAHS